MVNKARKIRLPYPVNNMHVHMRKGPLTEFMVYHLVTSGFGGYVVAEPNVEPAILDVSSYNEYKTFVENVKTKAIRSSTLDFLFAFQITEETTAGMVYELWRAGARVAKVYPKDVTTNSKNGVVDYTNIHRAFYGCQRLGIVVQFHCEHPSFGVEGRNKESQFILKILAPIAKKFPDLKISLEHISTAFAVKWIRKMNARVQGLPRIIGVIAPQYMFLTNDDVSGYSERSKCKAHTELHCKPMIKWNADRRAIQEAALSGEPWWVYGGDDAVHFASQKGPGQCNCGIFNTTIALPLVVDLAESKGLINNLKPLLSSNALAFYDLPEIEGQVFFEENPWQVPACYGVPNTTGETVIPMFAGEMMKYRFVG